MQRVHFEDEICQHVRNENKSIAEHADGKFDSEDIHNNIRID